ncbi:hypothetical protein ACFWXA_35490 [Streptomyces atroolivaceus]|uniref:hypothetical protein n=1 Tax=Streptomyces atroolivaceus TaxID=66869 RepID=UPI003658954B
MTYRERTSKEGWSDWELARLAVDIRGGARYGGILEAEVEPRMREEFTAGEVRRIDAYLAASLPDTDRLAAIKNWAADDETRWLVEQLTMAWAWLETLRDRIDDGGSLMSNSHVASAISYVRRTRETTGADPRDVPRTP